MIENEICEEKLHLNKPKNIGRSKLAQRRKTLGDNFDENTIGLNKLIVP